MIQGTTALIVSADAALRSSLRASLSLMSLGVKEAGSCESAMELFQASPADLVLLDDRLPEETVYALCAGLRRNPGWRHAARIVVLASDLESIRRARACGASDFITRPIDWTVFEERIRYLVCLPRGVAGGPRQVEWLRSTQRLARLANCDLNVETGELFCSEGIDHVLGRTACEPPRHLDDLFACMVEEDKAPAWEAFETAIRNRTEFRVDFRVLHRSGEERVLRAQSSGPVTPQWLRTIVQDITEKQRSAERISFLSFYDELTHLANRNLFKKLLDKAIAQARRHGYKLVGLFMDLDKFQRINDTLGPSVGDRLLCRVAERVQNVLRSAEWITRNCATARDGDDELARLGGDEFTILLIDIAKTEDAAKVARRVLDSLRDAFHVEGHEIFVSASIGITVFPDDSTDLDSFMKNGDSALFHAKAQGRNNYQFFSESLNIAASNKLALENRLRRALENRELVMHYQPKIGANSGAMLGLEALLRWTHPEAGMIPPTQFIPIAEETGLIVPIGEWVLDEVCRQAKAWEQTGLGSLTVAVNLCASQFREPDLCERVAAIISRHGIDPGRVEIELTESMLMHDVENAIRKMHELRDIGVALAIDDFGTGYSSLSYLMRFPLNTLKIDQSFVRDLPTDESCAAITKAIIAMARSLNLKVVAEGVEAHRQAVWLRENNCDILQGYYFSPALPPESLAKFRVRSPAPVAGEGIAQR